MNPIVILVNYSVTAQVSVSGDHQCCSYHTESNHLFYKSSYLGYLNKMLFSKCIYLWFNLYLKREQNIFFNRWRHKSLLWLYQERHPVYNCAKSNMWTCPLWWSLVTREQPKVTFSSKMWTKRHTNKITAEKINELQRKYTSNKTQQVNK